MDTEVSSCRLERATEGEEKREEKEERERGLREE